MTTKKAKILRRVQVDEHNEVIQVRKSTNVHRTQPCAGCPWRVDQTGSFPAGAFIVSAPTSYDAAFETFACHESGAGKPATCAGFLLRNAQNNVAVRIASSRGHIDWDALHDGGCALHASYRAMAIANGVDADDPALARCRADDE